METIRMGKQSLCFEKSPEILGAGSIVGKKEGEGPLGNLFDLVSEDAKFGENTWEEAESVMQQEAAKTALEKTGMTPQDIRYIFGGDLLGQLIATSFGVETFQRPLFGLYGACSTCGEALALGAMTVAAGYAEKVLAVTSSHFGGAEKQFRFPLEYGNQRPLSATWTVTGAGAFILGTKGGKVRITGVTPGKVVDYGVKDSLNMGACMAPAACDTIYQNLMDFQVQPEQYDRIFTGDLGSVGRKILIDLLKEKGFDISQVHRDCGMEIYDGKTQDTHAGGSGCGCSAVTLAAMILPKVAKGEWKRVLFVPTGALLSPVSYNEGQSVPGIAHGIILESVEKGE
jgi:stage V sporulation protein AD